MQTPCSLDPTSSGYTNPLGWCAALVVMFVVATATPVVAQEESVAVPAHVPCASCEGTGHHTCCECEGAAETLERCEDCKGKGRVHCNAPRCERGRKECTTCRGRGYSTRNTIGGGGGGSKRVPCKPCDGRGTVDCKRCEGGRFRCKVCKGERKVMTRCVTCRGKKRLDCSVCDGDGQVPTEKMDAEFAEYLRSLEEQLLGARAGVKAVLATRDKRDEEYQILEDELDTSRDLLARRLTTGDDAAVDDDVSAALRKAQRRLALEWEKLQISGRERLEAAQKLEFIVAERAAVATRAAAAADGVRSLYATYYQLSDDVMLSEIKQLRPLAREAQDYTDRLRKAVGRVETAQSSYVRRWKMLRATLKAMETPLAVRTAELQEVAVRVADTERRVQQFERRLSTAATRLSLPAVSVALLRDSEEFAVNLTVQDAAAVPAAQAEDVVLRDDVLLTLPGLVTAAFDVPDGIERLVVHVEGPVTSDTGHNKFEVCQRFTFERQRWRELTTGQFKEDWQEQLARSSPEPEFPRDRSLTLQQWLLIALPSACGVLVLAVVALRMVRDWGSWQRV